MKKKEKINYTVPILFLLYLALLIWIILFKLQFSILDLDQVIIISAAIVTVIVGGGLLLLLAAN